MEFWRYYRIIRKRRWLIILGMIICVGVVAISNQRTEQLYTGRTTLMESTGMSEKGIDIYAKPYMQLDTQLRLTNLGQLAISQRVLSNAAQTLSDLGMKFTSEEIVSNTSVEPVRETNIIAVEVTLPDPEEAKVAADVIASEFKKAYGELNNDAVRQSREFIEGEIETTRRSMVRAQNLLKQFKQENAIIMLDQESIATVQRVAQAKNELNNASVICRSAAARMNKLEQELKTMDEWQVASKTIARDPQWDRLQQQLTELETRKASMINPIAGPNDQRRGLKHREVQAAQNQIDKISADLKKVSAEYVAQTNRTKNPTYQSAMDRWLMARVELIGADAQRDALGSVLNDVNSELASLPAKEQKLGELMADLNAANQTYALMRNKLDEARIREQQAKNEIALKTIDPAYVFPVAPKSKIKLIIALLISPLLGIGVAFLLHYTDNTIKNATDAEKLLELPILSVVPGARAHCLPRQTCPDIVGVSYQMLTSGLWIASQNQDVNAVVMVSAEPDAGRSVTASNLAVCLAKEGARVVMVDADLRQPTQHLIFGVDNKVGLTNLLSGAATIEDVLVPTKVQGLLLVPTGPIPDNPVKLLRSVEMKDFADQIKDIADFVIYDTPAGVTFPDPILVAAHIGHAIVVHSAGRAPRGSEMEFRTRLESVGVHLLGAVLNKVKREDSSGYFHYHRSYAGVNIALSSGKKTIN